MDHHYIIYIDGRPLAHQVVEDYAVALAARQERRRQRVLLMRAQRAVRRARRALRRLR